MQPVTRVEGIAAPLMEVNVNTDVIVRIERLADFEPGELAPYAFESWRFLADGSENPDFPLNRDPWRAAPILIAGANFGCGSSREGAVWALYDYGIRAVIAPSFGGIFFNNCFQNGMVPVVLPADVVEAYAKIAADRPGAEFAVDLETMTVIPPAGDPAPFELDAIRRDGLMNGLDDLGLTLTRTAEIDAFQDADRARRPWVYEL